jgi:hypothetical protein
MTTTITANDSTGDSTTPELVTGYQTARASRNVVHDLIGGGIAVSLIAPRPRAGQLELLYPLEADGWAALALHARETSFDLVDDDVPDVSMSYVVDGSADLQLTLDDDTRRVWLLAVPYQEVTP